jgi:cytochrome c553
LVRSPVQQAARGGSRSPGAATVAAAAMPSGSGSIGRGATLALGCTMCHGAHGQSPADTPSLAGHSAQAIHKQLADFRSGIRPSAVMAPLMVGLSDADMRDLAAYYASLPRSAAAGRAAEAAPRIVAGGAPLRGIAPCGACHGAPDASAGDAPPLDGQPLAYLRGQLAAFATGARRNDPGARMRNVAQAMTPEEIETASQFYAAKPR